MENLQEGVLLMVVGMTTVFTVLMIVIGMGKLLIRLVNRYAPEQTQKAAVAGLSTTSHLPAETLAAIVSSVSVVTKGKGYVTKITPGDR